MSVPILTVWVFTVHQGVKTTLIYLQLYPFYIHPAFCIIIYKHSFGNLSLRSVILLKINNDSNFVPWTQCDKQFVWWVFYVPITTITHFVPSQSKVLLEGTSKIRDHVYTSDLCKLKLLLFSYITDEAMKLNYFVFIFSWHLLWNGCFSQHT